MAKSLNAATRFPPTMADLGKIGFLMRLSGVLEETLRNS